MINRNNYEEYFLLLADKELSPAEEAVVRAFAAQHPDLQEELEILLSCRLDAEPVPAFPKEKLQRTTTWNEAAPEPLQTRMLLLLDNELPPAERQQLQQQIAASTALQTEWATLQQTRLVAEAIVHPGKASLYRSRTRVRPLVWMRWAAAAAVITAMGWLLWIRDTTAPASAPEFAVTTPAKPGNRQMMVQDKVATVPATLPAAADTPEPAAALAAVQPESASGTGPVKGAAGKAAAEVFTGRPKSHLNGYAAAKRPAEAAPVPHTDPLPETTILHALATDDGPLMENRASTPMTVRLQAKPVTLPAIAAPQTDAVASTTVLNTSDDEEYINVGGARIRAQKVRGLLRTVSRGVSRSFSRSKMAPDGYAAR